VLEEGEDDGKTLYKKTLNTIWSGLNNNKCLAAFLDEK
jgi:hypothetical protein